MTDDELATALIGIFAYDTGDTDSGIHDEELRSRCAAEIHRRAEGTPAEKKWLDRQVREWFLSDEALDLGYDLETVKDFIEWLDDRMDYQI